MLALLRALCAGEDVIAGVVLPWARLVAEGSPVDELLVGDPMGLVDVTSRCQFRAAGLSMVVTPERRMSAYLPSGKGLGLVAVMLV
jgi:hypothetical protein